MSKLKVGQRVRIPNGSEAYIRFIGETDFKEGEWVGLELDEAIGKNNGTVNGRVYFQCEENFGMFMRPLPTIEVLKQPVPVAKPPSRAPPPPRVSTAAPASISRTRPSLAAPSSKRSSIAPSASSAAAKRLSTTAAAIPASRTSRLSVANRSISPKKPTTSATSSRTSLAPRSAGIRSPGQNSSRSSPGMDRLLSPGSSSGDRPPLSARSAPMGPPAPKANAKQTKDIEELQTKVQFLEKKRLEDREKLSKVPELETKQAHYEKVLPILETKCQNLHQQNSKLMKEAKELVDRVDELEGIQAEHESILELATLDREMAEEKAESYKAELDATKARMEEAELENEILRDENEELGKDMSPEERTSQGWLQLQRENERLRQALLRLRDLSQEQEEQLREDIKELQEDSQELADTKDKHEASHAKVLELEADNEDLREQLDAALGAETMIEQLTEKNLTQSEQLDELRKTVEHLQDLQELNDELEENHTEHERQLQEVISLKETQLNESTRRVAQQDESLMDREYTILRFRELVSALQSDLDDMRSSKEISEQEAQNLEHSSRAIMDMNRQLQASATSATVKAIDIEIQKLEAAQASDQLSIVQLFVPEAFNTEKDSILAYLRFKRVSFKARLLHGFVKQRVGESGTSATGVNIYAACDVLDKLTWLSAIANRFVASIEVSSLDQFPRFESTLHEVEPVERSLNSYLESLKKDNLQELQVAEGLQRSIAVMKHLSEIHLGDGLESFAEEVLMQALLMQSHLENTAVVLATARADVYRTAPPPTDSDDENTILFEKNSDLALSALRSAKVIAGKLHHVLRDMKARNLALNPDTITKFEKCNDLSSVLFSYYQALGKNVVDLLHHEDHTTDVDFGSVLMLMRRTSSQHFHIDNADIFSPSLSKLRSLAETLTDLNHMASDLSQLTEFEKPSPPWILRSKELQDRKAISIVAEEEIKVLKREIQERATVLKMRQQQLEEAKMKIELLDVRNKEANKKLERIVELEAMVDKSTEREKSLEKAIEIQTQAAQRYEEERDRWMRKAAEVKTFSKGNEDNKRGMEMVGSALEMDSLKSEVKLLQDTNQYLRQQFSRKRIEEETKNNGWLSQPLCRPKKVDPEAVKLRSVLKNIALLPTNAKPLRLADLGSKTKSSAMTRKRTPKALLVEEEGKWLSAWQPMADWKGPRIAGLDVQVL
ncbi:hypothetical protein BT63DRAFT_373754 [Microthyrium microscopicum]|uniref:CAP-Gly domain-containing protein n=1 Tax=Microthyrium microscopicum TaxID=703497 RepID=A0A6A6UAX0_9PEZI|nr:hypothetical protein BT63DRAFT_373754 [Microthyrium microscopicum]